MTYSICSRLWVAVPPFISLIRTSVLVTALALSGTEARAELVGYWNFDGNVNDASGNGNNGTIHGAVVYTNGVFGGAGGAAYFDGNVADYVSVPNSASLGAAWPGCVISFWCKKTGGGFPVSKIQNDSKAGVGQCADVWYWYHVEGAGYSSISAGNTMNSTWQNLVLRWDGANITSYRDGVQLDTAPAPTFANSTDELHIGKDNRGAQNECPCSIDEVAIFNTNLTVAACKAIYNIAVSRLSYSMADMRKLFALYAAAGGTTSTSDGKTWSYVASGLPGQAGQLTESVGYFSVILSDSGSAGVRAYSASAGLAGYWDFDGTLNDASDNNNHGTVNGTVPYANGVFGGADGALSFDGNSNNYVRVSSSASLSAAWPGFVVSFWGKTGTAGSPMGNHDGTRGFMQYAFNADGWYYGYGTDYCFISAGANGDSAWHNLVLRWDGAEITSYMDGVQQANATPPSYVNSQNDLCFGRDSRFGDPFPGYSGNPYTGYVDDAAIFTVALTTNACRAIYNVGVSPLGYSMGDMIKLFTLYAAAGGKVSTSDGREWKYVAEGLPGNGGELAGSSGAYSVIFSDSGSAGVQQYAHSGTVILLL
ncbi:MAG: hypothetical protein PHR35_00595 [Kiritimatiellae bacterium]|nr:hypothetical protein [Kiritimatiellia bacterium]